MFDFSRSHIEEKTLFGRRFYIKRDDLIHKYCNGNKARKFAGLPISRSYTKWISYGGNQSNAMFALAYLAKLHKIPFLYVMPETRLKPMGNLAYALQYGMQTYTLAQGSTTKALEVYAKSLIDETSLFIPQGGTIEWAMHGMEALAQELRESVGKKPLIFYTSGTGVGVIALRKALDVHFPQATLCALNCTNSKELAHLCVLHNVAHIEILSVPFAFAKPKRAIWDMRQYLADNGLICDLIYDSPAFCTIKAYLDDFKHKDLVFIHSGGLTGDITQKPRYQMSLHKHIS